MIIKKPTALDGCYEVELKRSGDDRGYFSSLTKKDFKDLGFKRFCQFSESKSSKGVLRGMHFQEDPYAQAKLVSVTSGKALDVVVDCRNNSKTFGKYVAVELDANKRNMLYVPRGFAHGFLSLEDNTVFQYFVDNDYAPKKEGGIAFDDKIVNIPWDEYMKKYNIDSVVLSDKDKNRNGIDKMPVDFSLKKNKYLVTGSSNMLGHDVVNELEERGENKILATTLDDFDITDSKTVMDTVKWYNPDVIIHCEELFDYEEKDDFKVSGKYWNINHMGTKNISEAAKEVGAKIIYPSTVQVFDGNKDINESYTEEDAVNPMTMYGASKYDGEEEVKKYDKHFIVRTSWLFGLNGDNYVKEVLRKIAEGNKQINCIYDQIGAPTYSKDLAKRIVEMAFTNKYGTYNITNDGFVNLADLAEAIIEVAKKDALVIHTSIDDYKRITDSKKIFRQCNSKLDTSKYEASGFERLSNYQDALERFYKKELKKSIRLQDKRII